MPTKEQAMTLWYTLWTRIGLHLTNPVLATLQESRVTSSQGLVRSIYYRE